MLLTHAGCCGESDGKNSTDRYNTVLAIKSCKIKFTEFRSDERRKVKLYMARLRRELMIAGTLRGETLLVKRMASQCRSTTFRAKADWGLTAYTDTTQCIKAQCITSYISRPRNTINTN